MNTHKLKFFANDAGHQKIRNETGGRTAISEFRKMSNQQLVKVVKEGDYPKQRGVLRMCYSGLYNILRERRLLDEACLPPEPINNRAFFIKKAKPS